MEVQGAHVKEPAEKAHSAQESERIARCSAAPGVPNDEIQLARHHCAEDGPTQQQKNAEIIKS